MSKNDSLQDRILSAVEHGKTYISPPPNEYAYSVSQLRFGSKDWSEEINEWRLRNVKRIEKAVRSRKLIDYRKDLGMGKMDFTFIHDDPNLIETIGEGYVDFSCKSLWRPDAFEQMLLSNGKLLAMTMLAARSGCDYGQIMNLSVEVTKIFNDEYIPSENIVIDEYPQIATSYPMLGNWERASMLMKVSGCTVIAKFILGLFFITNDIWAENATSITQYLPVANIPQDSNESGLYVMELDDNPEESAAALAVAVEKRNRRTSGKSIGTLSDMEDMFE